jgi:hypothetical protein
VTIGVGILLIFHKSFEEGSMKNEEIINEDKIEEVIENLDDGNSNREESKDKSN